MYNKNLIGPLQDLILENQTDIVALAEAKKIDITSLINSLKINGKEWNDIRISTQNDIRVLARNGIDIIPFKEENHYSIYKIKKNSRVDCLLVVVHLLSKKSKSNEAQYNRANHIARELNKYEQEIFIEFYIYYHNNNAYLRSVVRYRWSVIIKSTFDLYCGIYSICIASGLYFKQTGRINWYDF